MTDKERIEALTTALYNALDILQEFVDDVEVVYSWVKSDWPDVMVTYHKAKELVEGAK